MKPCTRKRELRCFRVMGGTQTQLSRSRRTSKNCPRSCPEAGLSQNESFWDQVPIRGETDEGRLLSPPLGPPLRGGRTPPLLWVTSSSPEERVDYMVSERSFLRRLWSRNGWASYVFLPGCGSPKEEVRSIIYKHSCMRTKSKCFGVWESLPPSD